MPMGKTVIFKIGFKHLCALAVLFILANIGNFSRSHLVSSVKSAVIFLNLGLGKVAPGRAMVAK
jgi:hypothetical protein